MTRPVVLLLPACIALLGATQQPKNQDKPDPAADLLGKVLKSYASAKGYKGGWNYILESGASVTRMRAEIRSSGTDKLSYRLSKVKPLDKESPDDSIPELAVIIDGTTAWFQNTTDNTYYKVKLPKRAALSPLTFFPQIHASSRIEWVQDIAVAAAGRVLLRASRPDGGTTSMEIDAASSTLVKIVASIPVGAGKVTSTLVVDTQVLGFEPPASDFAFKPLKGAKEIAAPPGAAALFGPTAP